jgi:hypothetical protein
LGETPVGFKRDWPLVSVIFSYSGIGFAVALAALSAVDLPTKQRANFSTT